MDERKCLYVPCKCSVAPGEEYCCVECLRSDLEPGTLSRNGYRCYCRHPDCEAVPELVPAAATVVADPSEALAAV